MTIHLLCLLLAVTALASVPEWKQRLQNIHNTIEKYNFRRSSSTTNAVLLPLLQERKMLLKQLAEHAPNDALHFCITPLQRQAYLNLVNDAHSLLERQVRLENATLAVVITMNHTQHQETASSTVERFVHLVAANKTYQAYVHGNYSGMPSGERKTMEGYLLDDLFLISHVARQQRTTRSQAAAAMTSQGNKRLLYIRVDFSDLPGEPVQQSTIVETLTNLREHWREASYGSLILESWTITPTLRLPQTAAHYAQGTNYIQLQQDARSIATQRGYVHTNYHFDIVYFAKISPGWAGRGYVQMQGNYFLIFIFSRCLDEWKYAIVCSCA